MPPLPPGEAEASLTAVDLFSGCGGLTTGLKAAGFRVVAAVECEEGALEAYRANHPEVEHVFDDDIRDVSGESILAALGTERGEIDLLAGCPPCQGFSRMRTLNRSNAAEDPRNGLVGEYLRLVDELLPRALMFENVPGLMRDDRYAALLRRIRELGYSPTDGVHDAADYGVPQRRHRLIMLAVRGADVQMPAPLPPESRPTVASAIRELPEAGASGDPAHDVTESRSKQVADLISRIPADGGSRRDLGPEHQLRCHQDCNGFYDVYGRMRWKDVAPTITSGFVNPSKGRFLHPAENRCVTPREAALLQTFPRDYRFPMSRGKYAVATMIGNAFPPELARRHAAQIQTVLFQLDARAAG